MTDFTHVSCQQINDDRQAWTVVDIRDELSFQQAHVEDAIRLDNSNVADFLASTSAEQPVAVFCYHGISSQQAATYLAHQGLKKVASVDGGFEYWRQHYAFVSNE